MAPRPENIPTGTATRRRRWLAPLAAACLAATAHAGDATPAPAAAPPAPVIVFTPEQRAHAERNASEVLEKLVAPARGNHDRLRQLLALPSHPPSSVEHELEEAIIEAFNDPAFIGQLAADMTDADLRHIQQHPILALEVAGEALGHAFDLAFRSLDFAQQKQFMLLLSQTFFLASPAECGKIYGGGSKASSGFAMLAVFDHLPQDAQRQFSHLLVQALRQPLRPPLPPLTADERKLVGLNITHYIDTQPEDARERLRTAMREDKTTDCWAIAHILRAYTTGDDELTALGMRLVAEHMHEE